MIIIRDTREKLPWSFKGYKECKGEMIATLPAGDYAIRGKGNLVIIDRKHTPSELSENLVRYEARFKRELKKMENFKYRYILCEFPYHMLLSFPKGCGLPRNVQRRIRARGPFLATKVQALSEEFNVEFIFCDSREAARDKAMKLFKEALENED
jgi:hypothetical protein